MKTKYLYTVLFIILLTNSCKKFDEGPNISFRSRVNRINNTWQVKKYIVDGVDSTSTLNEYFTLIKLDYTDKNSPEYRYNSETGSSLDGYYLKKSIISFYEPINFYDTLLEKKYLFLGSYIIKRLTKSELILECDPQYNKKKNCRIEMVVSDKDIFDY